MVAPWLFQRAGRVAEIAIALLPLTSFGEQGEVRAWKGFDWDVLDLL
jgi:hypothetical protein